MAAYWATHRGKGLVRDIQANAGSSLGGPQGAASGAGGAARGVIQPLLDAGRKPSLRGDRTVIQGGRIGGAVVDQGRSVRPGF